MDLTIGISVVIPVFNCERYVAEAIDSVLNQSYKSIQVILVDDGSTDNSPAICDQYAEDYDRVSVIHQKNSGVSVARNAGIEYVLSNEEEQFRHGYIAFLDADDIWMPHFFNDDILRLLNKGYHLVGFQTCKCNNQATRYREPCPMEEGVHQGKASSVWINSKQTFGSAFYSLKILEEYGICFPSGLRSNEDYIFSMQFKYLANTLCLVNRKLYLYRSNLNSATHEKRNVIKKYTEMIDAYLVSDALMEQYHTEKRGILREGHAMAAVYIIEMHQEHYRQFGRQRELDALFAERPEYLELITGSFARDREDSGLKWRAMKAEPVKFKLRCYAEGAMNVIMSGAYMLMCKSKWLKSVIEKKRYPHSIDQ